MPKKKQLEKQIRALARLHGQSAAIKRQGSHEIWECAGFTFPLPRHNEIAEQTARSIINKLTAHLEQLSQEN